MNELLVPRNKRLDIRLVISSIIGFGICAYSFDAAMQGQSPWRFFYIILIGGFAILNVIFLFASLTRLFKKSSALILNDLGIQDNITLSQVGVIPWENVQGCAIKKFAGQLHLVIMLHNNEAVLSRFEGFKHGMFKSKVQKLGTPVAIPTKMMNMDAQKIATIISDRVRLNSPAAS